MSSYPTVYDAVVKDLILRAKHGLSEYGVGLEPGDDVDKLQELYEELLDAAVYIKLAILELLLFTEGINCLTLGAGVPAQEIGGAARAYRVSLVILLFDRGISGKIAGQEIRSLRSELPADLPLIVSGRAVNLLAKPIASVRTSADFSSVMASMRELGVVAVPANCPPRSQIGRGA